MKSLIIPVLTAPGIPLESELPNVLSTGVITRNSAEGTTWEEPAINGAPQSFHDSCGRLLRTFAGRASGVLVGGPISEGPGMGPLQSLVALFAMQQACPPDITLYAGAFGGDDMVVDQVRSAQLLGIDNIVLGLNHTGNNMDRFQAAIRDLGVAGRLYLYNLSTFRHTDKDFIRFCLQDPRVVGFMDSSGDSEFFSWLLSLREKRPNFQVFHDSEPAYGDLSPEDLECVAGLVSSIANAHPALLHEFAKNPKNAAVARGQADLHESILKLSRRSQRNEIERTEALIDGLKRRLVGLCVTPSCSEVKIFSPGQDVLLSHPRGSLFQTYQK